MVVRKGKHARHVFAQGRLPVLLLVLAATTLAIGGTALAALRYDESNARRILPGVTVDGVDVGGLTRHQAVAAVRADAQTTLGSDLTIKAADRTWDVTPGDLGLNANVSGAIAKAMEVNDSVGFFSRVYHRALGSSVDRGFPLGFASRKAKIDTFVHQATHAVTTPAQDAGVALSDDGTHVVFQHAKAGTTLDVEAAATDIRSALRAQKPVVKLPMAGLRPKVADADLGYTIVISRPKNELYLYQGFEVIRSYPVATAMPGFTTPPGTWRVVNKTTNPTWVNPDPNGWGSGEPAEIPPGPGNPLGTRALYLDAPGIRIHGTYDSSSIGTYASHGCIRMNISDSEQLYPLVAVGTPVLII
jgi:lipoprotein-anchoring transpeptidase ErfK/SrfK